MKRRAGLPLLILVAVAVCLVGSTAPAGAGGWAVSTLDAVPEPQVGRSTEVGWTVRQHGITPVNLEEGDVGIAVTSPSGVERFFPATQEGPTGHYVADVVFPESGTSTWSIRQGFFPTQDLGPITVAGPMAVGLTRDGPAAAAEEGGASDRGPALVRFGFPALAALLVVAAVAGSVNARRRSRLTAPV